MSIELLEQLEQLPLRAIVAVAARCVRRVQRLVAQSVIDPVAKHAVERAIQSAEAVTMLDSPGLAEAVGRAGFELTTHYAREDTGRVATAIRAAATVAHAAYFAAAAADERGYGGYASWHASRAVGLAAAADDDKALAFAAAAVDIQKLLELKLGGHWELGRPIDPSENGPLGPLWPESVRASKQDSPDR
jgi:hypothetical protein